MNVLNWITNKKGFIAGAVVILGSAILGAVGKDILGDSIHKPEKTKDNEENPEKEAENGSDEEKEVKTEVLDKDGNEVK